MTLATHRSRKRRATSRGKKRRSSAARKISITVDAEVLAQIKRLLRKTGQSLSAHISEALAHDLRRRRLQQIIEEYEAEHGVITEAELEEIRAQWRA